MQYYVLRDVRTGQKQVVSGLDFNDVAKRYVLDPSSPLTFDRVDPFFKEGDAEYWSKTGSDPSRIQGSPLVHQARSMLDRQRSIKRLEEVVAETGAKDTKAESEPTSDTTAESDDDAIPKPQQADLNEKPVVGHSVAGEASPLAREVQSIFKRAETFGGDELLADVVRQTQDLVGGNRTGVRPQLSSEAEGASRVFREATPSQPKQLVGAFMPIPPEQEPNKQYLDKWQKDLMELQEQKNKLLKEIGIPPDDRVTVHNRIRKTKLDRLRREQRLFGSDSEKRLEGVLKIAELSKKELIAYNKELIDKVDKIRIEKIASKQEKAQTRALKFERRIEKETPSSSYELMQLRRQYIEQMQEAGQFGYTTDPIRHALYKEVDSRNRKKQVKNLLGGSSGDQLRSSLKTPPNITQEMIDLTVERHLQRLDELLRSEVLRVKKKLGPSSSYPLSKLREQYIDEIQKVNQGLNQRRVSKQKKEGYYGTVTPEYRDYVDVLAYKIKTTLTTLTGYTSRADNFDAQFGPFAGVYKNSTITLNAGLLTALQRFIDGDLGYIPEKPTRQKQQDEKNKLFAEALKFRDAAEMQQLMTPKSKKVFSLDTEALKFEQELGLSSSHALSQLRKQYIEQIKETGEFDHISDILNRVRAQRAARTELIKKEKQEYSRKMQPFRDASLAVETIVHEYIHSLFDPEGEYKQGSATLTPQGVIKKWTREINNLKPGSPTAAFEEGLTQVLTQRLKPEIARRITGLETLTNVDTSNTAYKYTAELTDRLTRSLSQASGRDQNQILLEMATKDLPSSRVSNFAKRYAFALADPGSEGGWTTETYRGVKLLVKAAPSLTRDLEQEQIITKTKSAVSRALKAAAKADMFALRGDQAAAEKQMDRAYKILRDVTFEGVYKKQPRGLKNKPFTVSGILEIGAKIEINRKNYPFRVAIDDRKKLISMDKYLPELLRAIMPELQLAIASTNKEQQLGPSSSYQLSKLREQYTDQDNNKRAERLIRKILPKGRSVYNVTYADGAKENLLPNIIEAIKQGNADNVELFLYQILQSNARKYGKNLAFGEPELNVIADIWLEAQGVPLQGATTAAHLKADLLNLLKKQIMKGSIVSSKLERTAEGLEKYTTETEKLRNENRLEIHIKEIFSTARIRGQEEGFIKEFIPSSFIVGQAVGKAVDGTSSAIRAPIAWVDQIPLTWNNQKTASSFTGIATATAPTEAEVLESRVIKEDIFQLYKSGHSVVFPVGTTTEEYEPVTRLRESHKAVKLARVFDPETGKVTLKNRVVQGLYPGWKYVELKNIKRKIKRQGGGNVIDPNLQEYVEIGAVDPFGHPYLKKVSADNKPDAMVLVRLNDLPDKPVVWMPISEVEKLEKNRTLYVPSAGETLGKSFEYRLKVGKELKDKGQTVLTINLGARSIKKDLTLIPVGRSVKDFNIRVFEASIKELSAQLKEIKMTADGKFVGQPSEIVYIGLPELIGKRGKKKIEQARNIVSKYLGAGAVLVLDPANHHELIENLSATESVFQGTTTAKSLSGQRITGPHTYLPVGYKPKKGETPPGIDVEKPFWAVHQGKRKAVFFVKANPKGGWWVLDRETQGLILISDGSIIRTRYTKDSTTTTKSSAVSGSSFAVEGPEIRKVPAHFNADGKVLTIAGAGPRFEDLVGYRSEKRVFDLSDESKAKKYAKLHGGTVRLDRLKQNWEVEIPDYRNFDLRRMEKSIDYLTDYLIERQKTTGRHIRVISGMNQGFDMLLAEATIRARSLGAKISLVATVPYEGEELKYLPEFQTRYRQLLTLADEVHYLSPGELQGEDFEDIRRKSKKYRKLQQIYNISHADELLTFWKGTKTGSVAEAVGYAQAYGKSVTNVFNAIVNTLYVSNKHRQSLFDQKNKQRSLLPLDTFVFKSKEDAYGFAKSLNITKETEKVLVNQDTPEKHKFSGRSVYSVTLLKEVESKEHPGKKKYTRDTHYFQTLKQAQAFAIESEKDGAWTADRRYAPKKGPGKGLVFRKGDVVERPDGTYEVKIVPLAPDELVWEDELVKKQVEADLKSKNVTNSRTIKRLTAESTIARKRKKDEAEYRKRYEKWVERRDRTETILREQRPEYDYSREEYVPHLFNQDNWVPPADNVYPSPNVPAASVVYRNTPTTEQANRSARGQNVFVASTPYAINPATGEFEPVAWTVSERQSWSAKLASRESLGIDAGSDTAVIPESRKTTYVKREIFFLDDRTGNKAAFRAVRELEKRQNVVGVKPEQVEIDGKKYRRVSFTEELSVTDTFTRRSDQLFKATVSTALPEPKLGWVTQTHGSHLWTYLSREGTPLTFGTDLAAAQKHAEQYGGQVFLESNTKEFVVKRAEMGLQPSSSWPPPAPVSKTAPRLNDPAFIAAQKEAKYRHGSVVEVEVDGEKYYTAEYKEAVIPLDYVPGRGWSQLISTTGTRPFIPPDYKEGAPTSPGTWIPPRSGDLVVKLKGTSNYSDAVSRMSMQDIHEVQLVADSYGRESKKLGLGGHRDKQGVMVLYDGQVIGYLPKEYEHKSWFYDLAKEEPLTVQAWRTSGTGVRVSLPKIGQPSRPASQSVQPTDWGPVPQYDRIENFARRFGHYPTLGVLGQALVGSIIGSWLDRSVNPDRYSQTNFDTFQEITEGTIAGIAMSNPLVGARMLRTPNLDRGVEEAKLEAATLLGGAAMSGILSTTARLLAGKSRPTAARVGSSIAGIAGWTVAPIFAPLIASVFLNYKKAAQRHIVYQEGSDMQAAVMQRSFESNFDEGSEHIFELEFVDEDTGDILDIDMESDDSFTDIDDVQDENGVPISFGTN